MGLSIIILAAGKGTRMRSSLPKVLHKLANQPLLTHVLRTAQQLDPRAIFVVYGYAGEQVRQAIQDDRITWVEQGEQLGTGHAVTQAIDHIPEDDLVLVLYGDVPLISLATLQAMLEPQTAAHFSLLTVLLKDPAGYGRIVRDAQSQVSHIVEEKDADPETKTINEVNTGILATQARALKTWLTQLGNNNAQGEYYLTDVIAAAVAHGFMIRTAHPDSVEEVLGVNDRVQLAHLERYCQQQLAAGFMRQGVTLLDPQRVDFRGDVCIGEDVIIDINVILQGRVNIGDRVRIGPNTVIIDADIADDVQIDANCVIEGCHIGPAATLGPFARIRPGTELSANVKVGNFVEIKKSIISEGSKINHLSYIGDTQMGADVNVGAGTITCNYDGAHKHQTKIGDRVFLGSDCQLIAPVTIEAGATIGAGSTITTDAPAEKLTLSRSKQITIENWRRPSKKRGS